MKLARTTLPVLVLVAMMPMAQAQDDHQTHHPTSQEATQTPPMSAQAPASGPGRAQQGGGPASMAQDGMAMMGDQGGMMMNMEQMPAMMRQMMSGMMGRPGAMGAMGGPRGMMPFEHVEGRLAFLRAELKITDAQTARWDAYADAFRSAAKTMRGLHDRMMPAESPATWPDRLDRQAEFLSAHLDAVTAIGAAARPLYEVLSEEQKRLADDLMVGPMGMM